MEVTALRQPALPALRGPVPLLRLQSDERLIALVRRGHESAFEALVARYQTRLLAFCRHMLSSREDAEDVLQEVFAAAFNAILADSREINVRPWLYRIARNRSLNHLRRATAIGVDSMDVHFAEGGQSTSDKVFKREAFRLLMSDVKRLPESQRSALLLREMDALSYQEISEAMETTVPSVKSLLVRARVSLAEAAEARRLSCAEVRLELGHVAEGLARLSAPARRHVKDCERCTGFRIALRSNNRALAAVLPVAPLLLIKKLLLTKIGTTASAGGATAAGAGGAGAMAGSAVVGTSGVSATGVISAGVGAIATKAVAGLAAAAIVTAGAVEARHVVAPHQTSRSDSTRVAALAVAPAAVPVVVASEPQRASATQLRRQARLAAARRDAAALARRRARAKLAATRVAPVKVAPQLKPAATPLSTQQRNDTTVLPSQPATTHTGPTTGTTYASSTQGAPRGDGQPSSAGAPAPAAGGPPGPSPSGPDPSGNAGPSGPPSSAPPPQTTSGSGTPASSAADGSAADGSAGSPAAPSSAGQTG